MKKKLEQLLDNYIENLNKIRNNVQIKHLDMFLELNTSEDNINKVKIEQIENKPFIIYIIKTKEKLTLQDAQQGYKILKENGYGAFRINAQKDCNHFEYWKNKKDKTCLYVGSSQDIRRRLKEHLGIIGKTTYALHLLQWWGNKTITVDLYEVNNAQEMQLYEDLLWDELKPLLGRQGKK